MEERISLDALTSSSVSVKTQKYVVVDDTEYAVGEPHRCAYVNTERGREEIATLPEPYLSAVMAVWGDTPTVVEQTD